MGHDKNISRHNIPYSGTSYLTENIRVCLRAKIVGTAHKVRHARGGGGPRKFDSLKQGEGGQEHVTLRL